MSGWLLTALLFVSVFLIDNRELLSGARVQLWDAYVFYTPAFSLVADHARAGRLLFWNPWLLAGSPDFADPQVGAASPIAILIGAIGGGSSQIFRIYWLIIWALGPLGLLLLARHMDVPRWVAFIVALGYAFCGFYTAHAEHTTVVYSFSFVPWFVWRFDEALRSLSLRPAAQAGALWGLSALGGYPAIVILSGGFLFLWGLGRSCCAAEHESLELQKQSIRQRLKFVLLALIVVLAIGVIVLAPTYLAFFREGLGYSERAGAMSRRAAIASTQNALNPGALATFASPYLTSLKIPYRNPGMWPGSDISVADVYIGVLPFILAVLAVAYRPRSPWRWWLLGILAFSLACAVGDRLPFRGWLYDYCPPTRYFTHPGMFRAYALFAAAILALIAGRDLTKATRSSETRIWKLLLAISSLASIAALCSYLYVISHVANLGDQLHRANRHLGRIWFGAVGISLLLLLVHRTRKWLPMFFVILAIMDASLTIRLSQDFVFDAGRTRVLLKEVDAGHKSGLMLKDMQREFAPPAALGGDHTNVNVSLRKATLFNDATMKNRFHQGFAQRPIMAGMALGRDRTWFARDVVISAPSNYAYTALINRSEELKAPVLVVHPPSQMAKVSDINSPDRRETGQLTAISKLPPAEKISAQVLRYTPNHLDLKVSSPQDGWLLVTDRWAAGWHAKVNGNPAEIFGGNFVFRAVRIRAGENTIEFFYSQRLYAVLVFLSWATLVTVFVLPRRKPAESPGKSGLSIA